MHFRMLQNKSEVYKNSLCFVLLHFTGKMDEEEASSILGDDPLNNAMNETVYNISLDKKEGEEEEGQSPGHSPRSPDEIKKAFPMLVNQMEDTSHVWGDGGDSSFPTSSSSALSNWSLPSHNEDDEDEDNPDFVIHTETKVKVRKYKAEREDKNIRIEEVEAHLLTGAWPERCDGTGPGPRKERSHMQQMIRRQHYHIHAGQLHIWRKVGTMGECESFLFCCVADTYRKDLHPYFPMDQNVQPNRTKIAQSDIISRPIQK